MPVTTMDLHNCCNLSTLEVTHWSEGRRDGQGRAALEVGGCARLSVVALEAAREWADVTPARS